MIRFLLKSSLLGAVACGVIYASGFSDQAVSWFKDSKHKVEQKLSELQGMPAELRKIERKIADMSSEIRTLREDAVKQEVEVEQLQREIGEREQSLEHIKGNLQKANSLLETDSDLFRIGGQHYSRAEVERDVVEKMRLYKVQEETLGHLRQTYLTQRNALDLTRENIKNGESLQTELTATIRLQRAKMDRFAARQTYAEAVATDFDAQDFNTSIGEARKMLARFDTMLEVKNRQLDERLKVNSPASNVAGIDYDQPDHPALNVRDELSALLSGTTSGNAVAFTGER